MKYQIRPCTIDDLDRITELCADHAAYEGAFYEKEGKTQRLADVLFTDNPPLHCWVVECDNKIVGYCSFTIDFSTWDAGWYLHMDCLYLEEAYRGFGIGKALLNKLSAEAEQRGCNALQWQTPIDNVNAIRFYKRMGAVATQKKRFTWRISQTKAITFVAG